MPKKQTCRNNIVNFFMRRTRFKEDGSTQNTYRGSVLLITTTFTDKPCRTPPCIDSWIMQAVLQPRMGHWNWRRNQHQSRVRCSTQTTNKKYYFRMPTSYWTRDPTGTWTILSCWYYYYIAGKKFSLHRPGYRRKELLPMTFSSRTLMETISQSLSNL